jgi:hypothetical protein
MKSLLHAKLETDDMRRWFSRIVLSRRWATFLVMGLAFFGFGLGRIADTTQSGR